MRLETGKFSDPESHHDGWFKVYHGHGILELWFGEKWIMFAWGSHE